MVMEREELSLSSSAWLEGGLESSVTKLLISPMPRGEIIV
jgi:hypothetical protein